MTQIRTDLALEAAENLQAGGPAAGGLSGVVTRTERRQGVSVTEVRILDETGARALGKPVGRYVTMELEPALFAAGGVSCLPAGGAPAPWAGADGGHR